jgi:hypothetical protein
MKPRLIAAIVFGLTLSFGAFAQDPNPAPSDGQNQSPDQGGRQGRRGGGWGAGMGEGRGVFGTVTEVASDHYTVKTETGDVYTVHFSANTRIMKAPERRRGQGEAGGAGGGNPPSGGGNPPQQIKASDIKVGDAIAARGELDETAKSVGAVAVLQFDPEQAKRMQEMEANFGKTWLMGKVTAMDGVKMTVQGGPGNAAHSFVADENTTFRKRREPITLGDVQVGDTVRVEGAVKDGTFVATTVSVMGMQGPPGSGPAGQPK